MPSASLGHDASLSFVVRGRGQHKDRGRKSEIRRQKKEEKDSPVGAAFPVLSLPVLSLSKGRRAAANFRFERF